MKLWGKYCSLPSCALAFSYDTEARAVHTFTQHLSSTALCSSFPVVHELTRVSPPLPRHPQGSPDPEVPDLLFTVGRFELGSFTGAVKPKASAEDSCFGPSPAWLTTEEVARSSSQRYYSVWRCSIFPQNSSVLSQI